MQYVKIVKQISDIMTNQIATLLIKLKKCGSIHQDLESINVNSSHHKDKNGAYLVLGQKTILLIVMVK